MGSEMCIRDREFYDLDSTQAYSTKHSEHDSKSVAGEIYNELALLRQRTVTNYETVSRMILWLRNEGAYDILDPETERAVSLKEFGWNNYRIFNFYDSARLMAEAALILQRKMDQV